MYAKLMARITESSLMEEEVPVRYCFMMLLAMADPKGYVIGTDTAISRRMNIPKTDFLRCIEALMQPDEDSNSKEQDGRRVIASDCERGYFVVNYEKYRDTRDEESRREYMRDYMRDYMRKVRGTDVSKLNSVKHGLAKEDGEASGEVPEKVHPPKKEVAKNGFRDGAASSLIPTTPQAIRIANIFHRKLTTPWQRKEVEAYRKLGTIPEDDLAAVERYYASQWPPRRDVNILRHDLITFLNNFQGEVDRAHASKAPTAPPKPVQQDHARWRAFLSTTTLGYMPERTALPHVREEFNKWLAANP